MNKSDNTTILKLITDLHNGKKIKIDNKTKLLISQFTSKVPLYDVVSNNVYLIWSENIYSYILRYNYRFVDEDLIQTLKDSPKDIKIKEFMKNYDLDVLKKTYYDLFYKSFTIEEYITGCRRPSFVEGYEHVKPYYTLNELTYLGGIGKIIDKELNKLDYKNINMVCKIISELDIPASTLISHQKHIHKSNKIGLVKYYSLFGSYLLNGYLRDNHGLVNDMFTNQLNLMNNLVRNAPPFDKDFIVFRFIDNDFFLQKYKVGDIFIDPGFLSTTRNPFLYKEKYQFGYILMKIKIPGNIKGLALCIESYSNFPTEEEIILPSSAKLKLINITSTDFNAKDLLKRKVKRRYDFEYVLPDEKIETIKIEE